MKNNHLKEVPAAKVQNGNHISNNKQTITSRDIAEVTGKRHSDILEAIRTMEPAWAKVTERNFPLSEYTDPTGRKLPQYELSKTECLYIATKFNDEARAKLIIRWEQLEQNNQLDFSDPATVLKLAQNWAEEQEKRIAAERVIIQQGERLQLQQAVIKEAAPKVEYVDEVLQSVNTYTSTQMAKELGLRTAEQLHTILKDKGIMINQSGQWMLTAKYSGQGYTKPRTHPFTRNDGSTGTNTITVWTEKGRWFLHNTFAKGGKK